MSRYIYLNDYDFLNNIAHLPLKTLYAKIIVLDSNENSIESIEGQCTAGSINVNASSAIRRSGQLTMIANKNNSKVTDVNNLISINKRIIIEVGIKNTTQQYTEYSIIWFKQGVFVITGASLSTSDNGTTISISFKDKMVLLNGEVGGSLSGAITHSPIYAENAAGETIKTPVRIYNILYELLTELGGLAPDKIIIEDIPLRIKQATTWLDEKNPIYISAYESGGKLTYDYSLTEKEYYTQFPYKSIIGYQYTDFTYPSGSDLTSSHGESICSILDKIKNLLGNYEYFFDRDGIFHFQKIKNGLNDGVGVENLAEAIGAKYLASPNQNTPIYSFENAEIVSSYSNSPNYTNIKNSFIVWGERKETKTPIRYHLVIDTPPAKRNWTNRTCYFKEVEYFIGETKVTYWRAYKEQDEQGSRVVGSIPAQGTWDWRAHLYYLLVMEEAQAPYAKEFIEEFPKSFNIRTGEWKDTANLLYFFDMLDPIEINHPIVSQFGVAQIGYRLKTFQDNNVDTLFAPKTQDLILIEAGTDQTVTIRNEALRNGQVYLQVPVEIARKLGMTSNSTAAFDFIRSCIHQYLSYGASVNLQSEPLYFLEPNSRVYIRNEDADINGDFIIESLNIPLDVNGKMTINAKAVIERI